MMKSPSEQVDPTNLNSMNQMNPGRRMSWQGQYQMNQVPQPQHHQGSDGQVSGPPQYYPEKMDMFPPAPSSYPAPTATNAGVEPWQNPTSSALGQYSHTESTPVQSTNSHFNAEQRDGGAGVNSNGMSGAAAAAAAAMVAAAHTAKGSPVYQKPANPMSPLVNAVHKPPPPVPPVPQRAPSFHPNYANVQSGVPPPNSVPPPADPAVQNHTFPPPPPAPHPITRPPNPSQAQQWATPTPMPNSMDHRPGPGYQHGFEGQPMPSTERVPSYATDTISGPMSNASSHDSEESRTKTVSARSTSQKLSALYEPDEPGRKDFIDSVLKYWEGKDLPLKHAPMMGGRTLDLYKLYQHVRNRGCMQEVSRGKKWSEISNVMGLGTTSASGFTLKKQYCKYLYGYECRTERQETEPQEALGRVLEANRKKKQLAEQSHAKANDTSHYGDLPPPTMMHHQHSMPRPPPPHHPGPMGYHQQQMPGYHHAYPTHGHSVHNPMPGPYEQQGYGGPGWQQQNPHYPPNRPMAQPRYSYRTNGVPPPPHPQSGPPMQQGYPMIPNRGRSPAHPQYNQQYPGHQPPHHNDMPPGARNMTPKPMQNMSESHPSSPAVKNAMNDNLAEGGAGMNMSQPMPGFQSPASTTPSIDDGSSNIPEPGSIRPSATTPQPYAPMPPGKPNEIPPTTSMPNHSVVRANTPKDHPDPSNVGMPHGQRPDFKMRHGPDMGKRNDPAIRQPPPSQYYSGSSSAGQEGYPPGGQYHPPTRGPERPPGPGMYQAPHSYHRQSYSPYGGNSQMSVMRQYGGQKRMPSMENFGPPSKMPRPVNKQYNAEQQRGRSYPPRPEMAAPHGLHPQFSQPSHQMRGYHPSSGQHQASPQIPRHMPRNESPSTRPATPDTHKSRGQIALPPESASNFLKGLVSGTPVRSVPSSHYHPGSHFPQGSVEAMVPVGGKMKEKSGQDLGVVEAWQIIMSLKSGLHAETVWALNALTVLLHDNRTVRHVILSQLPGLFNIITEHYRFCLSELFGISDPNPGNRKADGPVAIGDRHDDAEQLAATMATKCNSSQSTLSAKDGELKYSAAPSKLQSPYCKLPVRMVAGDDKFPLLLDTLWKDVEKPSMDEFVPISGWTPKDKVTKARYKIYSHTDCFSERAEMTFEDMLSTPSFVRSNRQNKQTRSTDAEVKSESSEIKREPAENMDSLKPIDSPNDDISNASHIQSCLDRFTWDCDVALIEEEAAGFPGNVGFRAQVGTTSWQSATRGLETVFPKQPVGRDGQLLTRTLCLSNIVRSLSCAVANHRELCAHQTFLHSLRGTLLLGHRHRVRCAKIPRGGQPLDGLKSEPSALSSRSAPADVNEITGGCRDSENAESSNDKIGETGNDKIAESNEKMDDSSNENIDKPNEGKCAESVNEKIAESSVVQLAESSGENTAESSREKLDESCDDKIDEFQSPWWWDAVRQLREDSLVVLANLSMTIDLSALPGEGDAISILDACLHWAVCPSADAQDPSPSHSSQGLGIEILTKLSMKEGNVDLILATKPYSRLEKFFKILTMMVGNRQNPVLREFSLVLLCNLCEEDSTARAVALQTGAIANLLSFLEECEETGLRHQRVFTAAQEKINCGTVPYMMQKCAMTLLKLARLEENRPLFLKHHLRMVSLSMSVLLGSGVQSLISAVLFELSRETPNR